MAEQADVAGVEAVQCVALRLEDVHALLSHMLCSLDA